MELQAQRTQDEASVTLLEANDSDLELPPLFLNSKQIPETKEESQDPKSIELEPTAVEAKHDMPRNVEESSEDERGVLPGNDVVVSSEPNNIGGNNIFIHVASFSES